MSVWWKPVSQVARHRSFSLIGNKRCHLSFINGCSDADPLEEVEGPSLHAYNAWHPINEAIATEFVEPFPNAEQGSAAGLPSDFEDRVDRAVAALLTRHRAPGFDHAKPREVLLEARHAGLTEVSHVRQEQPQPSQ
jgi:hypothetical protein